MAEKVAPTWRTRGAWFDQHPWIQFATFWAAFFVFRVATNRWLFSEDERVLYSLLFSAALSGVITLLAVARVRNSRGRRIS